MSEKLLGKGELKNIIGDEVYDKIDCNFNDKELNKLNEIRKRKGLTTMTKSINYDEQLKKSGKKLFPDNIILIETDKLKINPYQSKWFSLSDREEKEKYQHILASIKKFGIKTPLKITNDNIIIGGHRRHRIALELRLKNVPCQVCNYKLTNDELELHTIEDNYLQRETDSKTRKLVYNDLIRLVKKEFPNWEYLIREGRGGLQNKLEGIGLSAKTAEKIMYQEKRKAAKVDNEQRKGIIQTDYDSMIKNVNRLTSVYFDTNFDTKSKAKPIIIEKLKEAGFIK